MKAKMMIATVAAAFMGVVLFSTVAISKPEFATKEKVACTKCHVKTGDKTLNPCGESYKKTQKLDDAACKDTK